MGGLILLLLLMDIHMISPQPDGSFMAKNFSPLYVNCNRPQNFAAIKLQIMTPCPEFAHQEQKFHNDFYQIPAALQFLM